MHGLPSTFRKEKGLACLKGGNPIEVIYGIGPYLNGHDGRIRRRFTVRER